VRTDAATAGPTPAVAVRRYRTAALRAWRDLLARGFVADVAETVATRLLVTGLGLAASVVVARLLRPEGRGIFAVAAAIAALGAQFGNLGLHASNTYYVARDRTLLPALVGNTLVVGLALGALGGLGVLPIFAVWPPLGSAGGTLLALAVATIPFSVVYMLLQSLLLGIGQVRSYNVLEGATRAASLALVALLICAGRVTPEAILAAGLLTVVGGLIYVARLLRPHLPRAPWPRAALFRDTIGYGFKAYLAALLAFLVTRVDLLMVHHALGPTAAGHYSVAVGMTELIQMLPAVVGAVLFPRLSAIPGVAERWALAKRVTLLSGVALAALVASAAALAGPVVRLLYGEPFAPAVPAFLGLLPGTLCLGLEVVAVQVLNSGGFPKAVVGIWALGCALNVALNLYAIPAHGIGGAAAASSVSYLVVLALVGRAVSKAVSRDGSA
jgi:O-antigen/teichoic acid export membrane protein